MIYMTQVLTPADQFNLTLLHNIEDSIIRFSVLTYGPGEQPSDDAIECPYNVGKIYKVLAPTYLINLSNNLLYDPTTVAEDVYVPEDSILVFLGVERFFFEKNEYLDSFSIYTLRFLFEDNICFDLVPARFDDDNIDWTYITGKNVSAYMKKVLRGNLQLLQNT